MNTVADHRYRRSVWQNFLHREDGPTSVEYAVMLALIVVVCVSAVTFLGGFSAARFSTVSHSIHGDP